MKKNQRKLLGNIPVIGKSLSRWSLCMWFVCFSGIMHLQAQTDTTARVSLNVQNTSLIKIIESLRVQSRYNFLFNSSELSGYTGITMNMQSVTLKQALDSLLIGNETGLEYKIEGKTVIIKKSYKTVKVYRFTGVVLDENKQSMPGVTVRVAGSTFGTATDKDGKFALNIPEQKGTLEFSFVGYKTKRVPVIPGKEVIVILEEEVSDLNEVTVIGYGERNKRELVSSISSVKGEDIKEIPTSSFTNLLQGRMAGVEITNRSGAPGSGGTYVAVRGYNSLMIPEASDGQPLYVIDGVPMHSFTSPVTGTNALAELDPNTIESVEVLKDAAAAAIYGSRAGSGVILITTKKGKIGKANFAVNVSYTASIMPEFPLQLGGKAERWWKILYQRNYRLAGYDWFTRTASYPQSYREAYEGGGQYDKFWNAGQPAPSDLKLQDSLNPFFNNQTNWWKRVFRTGKVLNANIQASGGKPGIRYMVGMGYYKEKGIMNNSEFKRVNFIANLSLQPTKRIAFDSRFYLAYTDKSRNVNSGAASIEVLTANPMQTETILPAGGEVEKKILEKLNGTVARNDNYRMMLNAQLGFDIIKGLKFTASLGLDYAQGNSNVFTPSYLDYQMENRSKGEVSRNIGISQENLLKYTRNIDDVHRFELLLGLTYTENQVHAIGGSARRGASDYVHYVDKNHPSTHTYGTYVQALKHYESSFVQQVMVSYLGRVAYNYKLRYLMEFTYRRDGSSAFGEDVRYADFPAIAVGWSFGEEPFIKGWAHWLDMGKFRASWGTSGRTLNDPYLAHGIVKPGGNFMGNPGKFAPMINRSLKWEKSDQYDFGLDLEFLNYRLKLKLDYYYKYTKSLLYEVKLPSDVLGNTNQWQNAMEVSNEGIEVELVGDIIRRKELSWRTRFNISRNWNRFVKSYTGMDEGVWVIGRPLQGLYVYDDIGFVQNQKEVPQYSLPNGTLQYLQTPSLAGVGQYYIPGMRALKDINGDGRVSTGDKYYAGSVLPVAHGGWVHELRWKNIDLNLLLSYNLGRKLINQYVRTSLYGGTPVLTDYRKLDFWQKEGDFPDMAALGLSDEESVRSWIERVNFLRLKTLSLGYNVPSKVLKRIGLSGIRVFFTGENLFLWTNYSGIDPEVVNDGKDNMFSYPLDRKFTLGLTVNF
ncbi:MULTISPECIES: SusC/RagA family TonB-linked outer membrane protein [Sanguibacteroides]|uniref:SusC/RagA family TonB-linked outer membrane protein n=1 Tax=Sanguibacteroides TaxID=1635148 RepID=UPI000D84444C|nr:MULTISPECIES: SusC/RagA family TonB-linked outer membrane protein [Sanguibacteroides]PXZ44591.1 SusC/RagA family TonB-linked outer membrane protein [Sanguibacteroides justesenii]